MVGVQRKPMKRPAARLSKSEIRHMEMLLQEGKAELLDTSFHQKLADEFNHASGRVECTAIEMQQVQRWFLNKLKHHKSKDVSSLISSKEISPSGDESLPNTALQSYSDLPEDNGDEVSEEEEMEFEARSYRDQAWKFVRGLMGLVLRKMNGSMSGRLSVSAPYQWSLLNAGWLKKEMFFSVSERKMKLHTTSMHMFLQLREKCMI